LFSNKFNKGITYKIRGTLEIVLQVENCIVFFRSSTAALTMYPLKENSVRTMVTQKNLSQMLLELIQYPKPWMEVFLQYSLPVLSRVEVSPFFLDFDFVMPALKVV
jgi:hypothetical protein